MRIWIWKAQSYNKLYWSIERLILQWTKKTSRLTPTFSTQTIRPNTLSQANKIQPLLKANKWLQESINTKITRYRTVSTTTCTKSCLMAYKVTKNTILTVLSNYWPVSCIRPTILKTFFQGPRQDFLLRGGMSWYRNCTRFINLVRNTSQYSKPKNSKLCRTTITSSTTKISKLMRTRLIKKSSKMHSPVVRIKGSRLRTGKGKWLKGKNKGSLWTLWES